MTAATVVAAAGADLARPEPVRTLLRAGATAAQPGGQCPRPSGGPGAQRGAAVPEAATGHQQGRRPQSLQPGHRGEQHHPAAAAGVAGRHAQGLHGRPGLHVPVRPGDVHRLGQVHHEGREWDMGSG